MSFWYCPMCGATFSGIALASGFCPKCAVPFELARPFEYISIPRAELEELVNMMQRVLINGSPHMKAVIEFRNKYLKP